MNATRLSQWAVRTLTLEVKRLNHLRALWLDIYAYYGETPARERLNWYAQDMADFGVDEVEGALAAWRQTPPPPGHRPRPPLPVDVIRLLRPELSQTERASAIAAQIYAAIGKLGSSRQATMTAREELGPDGWQVVQELGGWANLCATTVTDRRDTFHAQTRDVAKAVLARQTGWQPAHLRGLSPSTAPAQAALPAPSAPEADRAEGFRSFGEVAQGLRQMGLGDVLERMGCADNQPHAAP